MSRREEFSCHRTSGHPQLQLTHSQLSVLGLKFLIIFLLVNNNNKAKEFPVTLLLCKTQVPARAIPHTIPAENGAMPAGQCHASRGSALTGCARGRVCTWITHSTPTIKNQLSKKNSFKQEHTGTQQPVLHRQLGPSRCVMKTA